MQEPDLEAQGLVEGRATRVDVVVTALAAVKLTLRGALGDEHSPTGRRDRVGFGDDQQDRTADRGRAAHGPVRRDPQERARCHTVVPVARLGVPDERQPGERLSDLMLDSGEVRATGVQRSEGVGIEAVWTLSWPEQRAAGIGPIVIRAYFGLGFLHPHLRSGTVGDWPLNVFDDEQAAAELPTLRSLAAADIHNLVLQLGGDYGIVPAVLPRPRASSVRTAPTGS